jgi:putative DNA primase/helicase
VTATMPTDAEDVQPLPYAEARLLLDPTAGPEPAGWDEPLGEPPDDDDPPPPAVRVLAERRGDPTRYGPTEDGIARALVARHGDDLRYCPQRGKWLTWDSHRWAWDESAHHRELVKNLGRQLPEDVRVWAAFKSKVLTARGVGSITRLAESDPAVVVPYDQLDGDPWAINTPGGVVDLRTGKLGPSDRRGNHTRSTSCAPDPEADPGPWRTFLDDTFGGDEELISYLQRLVGYSAIGMVREHVLPFCFGSGGNGKGVFLEAVTGVLGDYATSAPVGFLMSQAHSGHETEIARLAGARMVICSEVNETDSFDEAKVKQLTGGDTLTARFMRQDHFSFKPSHNLWLMGNHKPAVRSGGRSFWRRLRLIPFQYEVPEDKIVEDLQGWLVREHGPAILAWIVQGAADYHLGSLREPGAVKAATDAYAMDQDTVAQFLDERCYVGGGANVKIKVAIVRDAYEQWCHTQGEKPVSAKAFGMALKSRFGIDVDRTKSARLYVGLGLRMTDEDEENASPDASPGPEERVTLDGDW